MSDAIVTEPTSSDPARPDSTVPGTGRHDQADGAPSSARVTITYCTQCRWLMRAAWVAQELLTTFRTRLGEVTLVPGTGGVFRVELDPGDGRAPAVLWDRAAQGGFPEIPPLKKAVRDAVAPELSLGHTDRVGATDQ